MKREGQRWRGLIPTCIVFFLYHKSMKCLNWDHLQSRLASLWFFLLLQCHFFSVPWSETIQGKGKGKWENKSKEHSSRHFRGDKQPQLKKWLSFSASLTWLCSPAQSLESISHLFDSWRKSECFSEQIWTFRLEKEKGKVRLLLGFVIKMS